MKQYKINRDGKVRVPSEEMIRKHQDYNKFKVRYDDAVKRNRLPLYKNPRMFLFLIIIAALAYLVAMAMEEEDAAINEKDPKTELTSDPSH